jgi:hypothetical protein
MGKTTILCGDRDNPFGETQLVHVSLLAGAECFLQETDSSATAAKTIIFKLFFFITAFI